MAVFDDLGSIDASVNLAVAQNLGTTMTLSHRGAVAITLNVLPMKDGIERVTDGQMIVERRYKAVQVATGQTGFSATSNDTEPVTLGDKVVMAGRNYFVSDVQRDEYGKTYVLRLVEDKDLVS
jgi:hypothetical protein